MSFVPTMRRAGARRSVASVLGIGALACVVNAAISLAVRRPEPAFHDEFSYLLAADTFSSGRLTNPTHPHWIHFETFHVIQRPSYQSKFPPGQGLLLALGRVVGDSAIVGLWLGAGLASGALTWALIGVLPLRWALLGGLLSIAHPTFLAWWGQTFWGGNVAMFGGALAFGAWPRLWRRPSRWLGLSLGAGLGILAVSRPAEGAVATAPLLASLVLKGWRRPSWRRRARTAFWGAAAVLTAAAGFLLLYHARVTGDPMVTPYQVWWRSYQGPEAVLRHQPLRDYGGSPALPLLGRLVRLGVLCLPGWFAVPLLALPLRLRSPQVRLALGILLVVTGLSVGLTRAWPHYVAPVVCLLFFLVVEGLRCIRTARPLRGRAGALVVGALVSLQLAAPIRLYLKREPAIWFPTWQSGRAGIVRLLTELGGWHLVFVSYSRDHDPHREWVQNGAAIDGERIVWARRVSPSADARLVDYFRYRRVWMLEADANPPRLIPFAETELALSAPDGVAGRAPP